ncbi:MAG: heme biosynthesis protein HemY [Chromatiaceae bacterium]|nr:heme biosynthesis protein HemY [Gammaproteobacteria bacterium]MCP5300450.1 heme biosynthesis protein HemY [Chromatiaceae bacterium]MCP5422522.1 heme biosynthesis protein HemY [Chromatiaceae bacterium]
MRTLLKIWLFVLAGAGIGVVLSRDSGYVLLSFGNYTVEMSLALLLMLLALLFAALYFGIRLVVRTLHLPQDVRDWKHRRGSRLAQQAMTRGLLEMSEGNWRSAEKRLVRFADRSETPLLNYLAAARAAQLQGAHERRDVYIRLAHETMPSADVAVSLTQAELQLADHQLEQALATLKHLRSVAPKHNYVLRLLRRLYEQLGDWEHLRELLPELRRRKVDDEPDLQRLEIRTHRALLEQAFLARDERRLGIAWADVPRGLRDHPQILGDYAGYLQEQGQDQHAEKLLREALRKHWDTDLVETYGLLDSEEPGRLLSQMEKFLAEHPDDATLLLTLGRLSLRAQLWGKARGYLEACIGRNGPPQAYRELGQLLERMHEPDKAIDIYRQGLSGTGGPEPVPLPQTIGKTKANRPMLDEQRVMPPHHAIGDDPEPST